MWAFPVTKAYEIEIGPLAPTGRAFFWGCIPSQHGDVTHRWCKSWMVDSPLARGFISPQGRPRSVFDVEIRRANLL